MTAPVNRVREWLARPYVQFVWWGWMRCFDGGNLVGLLGHWPESVAPDRAVYAWRLLLGPVEIRRWR